MCGLALTNKKKKYWVLLRRRLFVERGKREVSALQDEKR